VTAVLGDVLTVDAARHYPGGYNLNVTLPSGTSVEDIRALAEGFFGEGGQELQVNCLDAAQLRVARSHPEAHRGLVVRVAGLSARFVELSRVEQDELIRRAEMAGAG
jgi:formate C-acetyltransferase